MIVMIVMKITVHYTFSISLYLTHTIALSLSPTLSPSLTHTHSFLPSLSYYHTHTHPLSLSLPLTPTDVSKSEVDLSQPYALNWTIGWTSVLNKFLSLEVINWFLMIKIEGV